jgi:hypothetical protein
MAPTIRNFLCPLTETACTDDRCKRDQCAQRLEDEARRQEIELQRLNDPTYRKAAHHVLDARVNLLNSHGIKKYCLPCVAPGITREYAKQQYDEMIDRLLTSLKHRSLVRAAVAGLPLSPHLFIKDKELDSLFFEELIDLNELL